METKLTTKGQIVLPGPLRRKLGLQPGDLLDACEEDGRVILTPRRKRFHKAKIVKDPITGLPVLTTTPGAPKLTSKEVEEILAGFP